MDTATAGLVRVRGGPPPGRACSDGRRGTRGRSACWRTWPSCSATGSSRCPTTSSCRCRARCAPSKWPGPLRACATTLLVLERQRSVRRLRREEAHWPRCACVTAGGLQARQGVAASRRCVRDGGAVPLHGCPGLEEARAGLRCCLHPRDRSELTFLTAARFCCFVARTNRGGADGRGMRRMSCSTRPLPTTRSVLSRRAQAACVHAYAQPLVAAHEETCFSVRCRTGACPTTTLRLAAPRSWSDSARARDPLRRVRPAAPQPPSALRAALPRTRGRTPRARCPPAAALCLLRRASAADRF